MVHRQHGEHRLQATCAAQEVARHGLGGIDHHLFGVVAQGSLDGIGLVDVTQRRRSAVRIQVVDLVRVHSGIAQGAEHRAARAVHVGGGHVAGIGAHAEARQLGVNLGATGFGVFVLFEHHHAATLAQHKTIAVLVPGARGGCGVIVAGGEGAHGSKPANAQW